MFVEDILANRSPKNCKFSVRNFSELKILQKFDEDIGIRGDQGQNRDIQAMKNKQSACKIAIQPAE